ncbi:PH domain-containing protein [Virgibacillus pantothenticus]|uniref:PH domain-containing protein n=1 Tax=Virgibacillus pantothenticus TaxID=1473 RepID=UPI0009861B63|nr:PH domain-containing protein [Virgibacillus pantothenticus]
MSLNNDVQKPHIIWVFVKLTSRIKELILGYIFLNTFSYFDWVKSDFLFQLMSGLFALFTLLTIFEWKSISYTVNKDHIIVKKGFYNKRKTIVKFNNINSLVAEKNLLHKVFKLQTFQITADSNSELEDLNLEYLNDGNSQQLNDLISYNQCGSIIGRKTTASKKYKVGSKSLILNSLISLKLFMVVPLYFFITSLVNNFVDLDEIVKNYFKTFFKIGFMNILTISICVISLAIFYGIIYNLVFLKDFTLEITKSYISVTSGLIKKKNNFIEREKIGSIVLTKNIVERILKVNQLKCVSYTNDNQDNDEVLLFPIVKLTEHDKIINDLGLKGYLKHDQYRIPIRSLVLKVIRFIVLIFMLLIFDYFFDVPLFYMYSFGLLVITNTILKSFYDRISFYQNNLSITNGGLFWNQYFIKKDKVEFIQITQSLFQKSLELASINIMIRKNPYKLKKIKDIDFNTAQKFKIWYERDGVNEPIGSKECFKDN